MTTSTVTNPHQEIKDRVDLVDYIEKTSGIKGKKAGKKVMFNASPCCGHNDCFFVDTNDQLFSCFSCMGGKGGDVFTYAEKVENIPQEGGESLKHVAEAIGYELPKKEKKTAKQEKAKDPVEAIRNAAVAYYQARLRGTPSMVQYLTQDKPQGRGHVQRTIDKTEVGLADGMLGQAMLEQGHKEEHLIQTGLWVERPDPHTGEVVYKDLFGEGLLVYPHRLINGKIGQFTCKDPSKKRKGYQLNTEFRHDDFFWGNQAAIERSDEIHLVEGEDDLASWFDAGIKNTLMANGSLSDAQIGWLARRADNKNFYLWFDNDPFKYSETKGWQPSAGIRYVRKIYKALLGIDKCNITVCSHLLGDGVDPDDFVQQEKDSAHHRILKTMGQGINPLSWELEIAPDDVKKNPDQFLKYLQSDDVEFFEYLPKLPELLRGSTIKLLEPYGFSRDAILGLVKDTYSLAEEIAQLKEHAGPHGQKQEGFMRSIALKVWGHFSTHGMFFVSSGDVLNLFFDHKTYEVGKGDAWASLLHKEAGLNNTTQLAKYVNEEIKAMCYQTGKHMDSMNWTSRETYDDNGVKKNALFFNFRDEQNRILKVTANNIEQVPNGTNADKVMLTESDMLRTLKYIGDVDVPEAMGNLKRLVFDMFSCPPAQRYLVLAHGLSTLIMSFNKVRALMKLEGGSGSGKTTAARLMGFLLYGKDPVVNVTTASAYELGAREPLIVLDNIEKDDLKKEMLNFLLFAATGASRMKRAGGSDHGVTGTELNTLIMITAIEPFVKPELINRTFIILFGKKHRSQSNVLMEEVNEEICSARNEIISAYLQIISNSILPTFDEDRREVVQYLNSSHPEHSKDRMNEFIAIYALITKAILPFIPLDEGLQKLCDASGLEPYKFLINQWLGYQNKQAKETEKGTNQVLQFLEGIRSVVQSDMELDKLKNVPESEFKNGAQTLFVRTCGLDVTKIEADGLHEISFRCRTSDLLRMFQNYAKDHGIRVPFDTSRQLAARMSDQMPVLNDSGWTWNDKKKTKGDNYYLCKWTYDESDAISHN